MDAASQKRNCYFDRTDRYLHLFSSSNLSIFSAFKRGGYCSSAAAFYYLLFSSSLHTSLLCSLLTLKSGPPEKRVWRRTETYLPLCSILPPLSRLLIRSDDPVSQKARIKTKHGSLSKCSGCYEVSYSSREVLSSSLVTFTLWFCLYNRMRWRASSVKY